MSTAAANQLFHCTCQWMLKQLQNFVDATTTTTRWLINADVF